MDNVQNCDSYINTPWLKPIDLNFITIIDTISQFLAFFNESNANFSLSEDKKKKSAHLRSSLCSHYTVHILRIPTISVCSSSKIHI
jgi:hypothetical protein